MTDTQDAAGGFSAEERAAMKQRAQELKPSKAAKAEQLAADDLAAAKAAIAKMSPADRALAENVDRVVLETAPDLAPKTYYGMPAYARDGKVVCFFKNAGKFKTRYSSFEFNDIAQLDDGVMWPISYALTEWSPDAEKQIRALVTRALG